MSFLKNKTILSISIGLVLILSFFVFAANSSSEQTALNLILDKLSFIKGDIIDIGAKLTYKNDSPVPNQQVNFYFDEEKIMTETTDELGIAKIKLDTSPLNLGIHRIIADYGGKENLEGSHDSDRIKIEEANKKDLVNEPVTGLITETITSDTNATTEAIATATTETIQTQTTNPSIYNITKIEDCVDVPYEEREKVYGTCSELKTLTVCNDPPLNTSCSTTTQEFAYRCLKEVRFVQKTNRECTTNSYVINNAVKLNTQNYKCSTEESSGQLIFICDSKYDGDENGKCKSGESCMKFVYDGTILLKYEKNSREDFIEEDESYFLGEISTEVLK